MIFHPITFLLGYYVTGLLLLVYGPILYVDAEFLGVVVYVSAFIVIFLTFFILGLLSRNNKSYAFQRLDPTFILSLLPLLFWGMIALTLLTVYRSGVSSLSFSSGAGNYASTYENYERNSGSYSVPWLISEAVYPAIVAAISMGFYYLPEMNFRRRAMLLATIGLVVLLFGIMAGKQKIIGDVIIIGLFFMFVAVRRKTSGFRYKFFGTLIGAVGLFVILLVLAERYELAGISIDNINDKGNPSQYVYEDSRFVSLFGPKLGFAIIQLTAYLTNGYFGLSLALKLPFEWTGFIGNSYSIMVIYDRFLGGEFLLEHTYPYRVGEVYDWGLNKWHTAFAWYASDFTFFGTLIFFAVVAFIYGRAWRAVTRFGNPYAAPFFGYLSVGMVFVPANNQLLISPGGILALVCFALLWIWSGGPSGRRAIRRPSYFLSTGTSDQGLPPSSSETAR